MDSDTRKQRILIVDDDPMQIDVLKGFLNRGYTLMDALDGKTALKILNSDQPPDIVLLDILMDEMDGFEVCREIKDNPATEKIPVIFLTGKREPEEEVKGLEAGAVDYITKPIIPAVILSRVKIHLELKQIRERLEKQNEILSENIKLREKIKTISARRWAQTIDVWPEIVLIIDEANYIIECNQVTELQTEIPKNHMIGLGCHEALCRDDHSAEECEIEKILRENLFFGNKLILPILGGYYEVDIISLERDIDASDERMIIFRDVTELKSVAQKTEENLHFLQELIDSIPSPIYYKDTSLAYLGCNKAFVEYAVLEKEKIVGRTIQELYPGRVSKEMMEQDKLLIEQKGVQSYEAYGVRPDGTSQHVLFSKGVFTKMDGSIGGLVGVLIDVTDRKKSEDESRRVKEELERLISSITSILIGVDREKKIIRWNAKAEETFGISAKEAWGKNINTCAVSWDIEIVTQEIDRCIKNRERRLNDINFKRQDGTEGVLGLTISPVTDEHGESDGFLLLGSDITARRNLEIELVHARKLESVGQLAAGIAHEINTPTQYVGDNTRFIKDSFSDIFMLLNKSLEVVSAYKQQTINPEMVKDFEEAVKSTDVEYLSEEIPRAISQSIEGVERIAAIVGGMKEFSHPGGKEMKPVNLNSAIESTITVSRNEWKYVADMETKLDPGLPMVTCLAGDFNQLILNIIVNAAHAIESKLEQEGDSSKKGKITVCTNEKDGWVEIRISDTGTGIPESIRNRIFDPFFTTKDVGRGTGQGLAIAHTIIEKHKGTLRLESEINKGTAFIIRIPVSPE